MSRLLWKSAILSRRNGYTMGPSISIMGLFVQRGESSTHCPFALLNPGETNREQEGDEPRCLDR
jgi:hypothetical protein